MPSPYSRGLPTTFVAILLGLVSGCGGFIGGSATSMGSRWEIYAGGGSFLGTHPSVSPDGVSMVYSTPATGNGDIYRFDRTTGKHVRLTTDPEYDGYPVFSRDGRHIVFEHETNGISHLYVMDYDGKNERPLTDEPAFDFGASFSNDGRTIVFCRDLEGVCHLWAMDADGGNPRPLTDGPWFDSSPLFSPDDGRIVFARMEKGQIHLTPPADEESLSRRFAEVYVMNADGTGQHRLTHNSDDDVPISFSADGSRLFFRRASRTWVVDSDGRNGQDLGEGYEQALSLDGRQVAFGTLERGRDHGVGVMNADGTGRRVIYPTRTAISELSFTPDGAHVVFVEWPDLHGAGRIKIVNVVTSEIGLIPEIR
jgi:Tol biopolymer transport system component